MNAEISIPFVEDPELWKKALSFKPGVDQNTALHACPTAGPAFVIFPLSFQDSRLSHQRNSNVANINHITVHNNTYCIL